VTLGSDNQDARGSGPGAYQVHQGVVTIDVLADGGAVEIAADVERLGDAQQRYYLDVPYVGMAPGRASAVRLAFDLPVQGLPASPVFSLRFWALARSAGTFPGLTLTGRVLPRPTVSPSPTPLALPTTGAEVALTAPLAGIATLADRYVEVATTPIAVTAGARVLVLVSRSASDGYAGELGILRATGVVTPAP
jgi:hypothetical protein